MIHKVLQQATAGEPPDVSDERATRASAESYMWVVGGVVAYESI